MRDAYELVTNKIIESLEKGVAPWTRPWAFRLGGANGPRSMSTGRAYRGVNRFLLAIVAEDRGYATQWWGTFNQIKKLGGHVRKGEKSTQVILWNVSVKDVEVSDPETGEKTTEKRKLFFLRTFNVFNAAQCDGLPEKYTGAPAKPEGWNPIENAEKLVAQMQKRPEIRDGGDRAFYHLLDDYIGMPSRGQFADPESYYATLFHEMTHSTGHKTRLGRHHESDFQMHNFGDENYSREELVAEMGSAFLCAETGIEARTLGRSAAYVASWLTELKNDKKLVVYAAAQAEKAADFILNRNANDETTNNSEEE